MQNVFIISNSLKSVRHIYLLLLVVVVIVVVVVVALVV
jgi:hypothetical protein